MVTVKIISDTGEINFSPDNGWMLFECKGAESVKPDVEIASNAQYDGGYIESSRVISRDIVLTVSPLNRLEVESKRAELLATVLPHKPIRIEITRNDRTRVINGYMDSAITVSKGVASWSRKYKLSFVCPSPYLEDEEEGIISFRQVAPVWAFPWNSPVGAGTTTGYLTTSDSRYLLNTGDTAIGVVVTITAAKGAVTNPSITDGTHTVKVNITMALNDVLTISTVPGDKYIKKNGSNYFFYTRASEFFSIEPGVVEMTVDADSGLDNLTCEVKYKLQYSGV